MRDGLLQHGFRVGPSQANFLLAEVGQSSPCTAREIYQGLKARGVLVRHFDTPLLADKLRITVGTPEQNQTLLSWLDDMLTDDSKHRDSES